MMKPVLVTSGEPAGIGPDICLALVNVAVPLVVLGDVDVLRERAAQLKLDIHFKTYTLGETVVPEKGALYVWHVPVNVPVTPGQLDVRNAAYVLALLQLAVDGCMNHTFSALVTAPVHKGVINDAALGKFSGHTEFLAQQCGVEHVVMLLVCKAMRVALVTTHLPLAEVPSAITSEKVSQVIELVYTGLQTQFAVTNPHILVAGLNPHAGEDGHLGREEIDVIAPAIQKAQSRGWQIEGPLSADTLFTHLEGVDAVIAMYHDQGLPVLKYAGFGEAVNVTLGLPIIRTSVDHGTALSLAGTGKAEVKSLLAAVELAKALSLRGKSHV